MKKSLLPFLLLLVLLGCSTQQSTKFDVSSPIGKLGYELSQKFDDPEFENAHWGVLIRSLKTGETVYSRNEKKMFMPASNMKLFTTSSAMKALGPDYRYTTRLVTTGSVKDSVLNGSIIVVGSGDPTISGRYNDGNVTETFAQWADSLRSHGIKAVNGSIIGDDNCFDDEFYGSNWAAEYETDYYAAQISGISFNDNCVDFRVVPSANAADVCSLSWTPNTKYVNVINQTVTAPVTDSVNDISFYRVRGTNTIYVRGAMSVGKKELTESVAIDNPTLFTVTVLKEILESKGIRVNGNPVDADELKDSLKYDNVQQLASFTSVPYSVMVRTINKQSQNFYTEQVYRTMGKESAGRGSMESGRTVVKPILAG